MPVPVCCTKPAPEIAPDAVNVPDWLNTTVPASAMVLAKVEPVARLKYSAAPLAVLTALDDEMDPVVPLPICKVPPETVVAPV